MPPTRRGAFEDKRREGTLNEIVFLTLALPFIPARQIPSSCESIHLAGTLTPRPSPFVTQGLCKYAYIRTRPHCLGLTKAPSSGEPLQLFHHLRSTTRIHYIAINEISTGIYARQALQKYTTTHRMPPSLKPYDCRHSFRDGERGRNIPKCLVVFSQTPRNNQHHH